jgi:uncharacterized SAM-binding protein YcdF (DUF218 family)
VAVRRSSFLKLLLAMIALCAILYFAHGLWLPAFGYGLIHNDGPAKADYAVVLGGDPWGNRIVCAADLVRDGYVPVVLVSGPPGYYGFNEADAAIHFAVNKGFPKEWFIPVRHRGLSTKAEAYVFAEELQRRNAHSFLLVTSNYHSARSRRTFLNVWRTRHVSVPFRMVAAPDEYFTPEGWWHDRESRKTTLLEWVKSFAEALGL